MSSQVIPKGEASAEALTKTIDHWKLSVNQRVLAMDAIASVTDTSERVYTYEQFYDMALADCDLLIQPGEGANYFDADGNPDGGWAEAKGLQIRWGREADDNGQWEGCLPITALYMVWQRLTALQDQHCDASEKAIEHIHQAIEALKAKIVERFKREGCV